MILAVVFVFAGVHHLSLAAWLFVFLWSTFDVCKHFSTFTFWFSQRMQQISWWLVVRYDVVHMESWTYPKSGCRSLCPNQMTACRCVRVCAYVRIYFLRLISVCLMCFIRCKSFSVNVVFSLFLFFIDFVSFRFVFLYLWLFLCFDRHSVLLRTVVSISLNSNRFYHSQFALSPLRFSHCMTTDQPEKHKNINFYLLVICFPWIQIVCMRVH